MLEIHVSKKKPKMSCALKACSLILRILKHCVVPFYSSIIPVEAFMKKIIPTLFPISLTRLSTLCLRRYDYLKTTLRFNVGTNLLPPLNHSLFISWVLRQFETTLVWLIESIGFWRWPACPST